MLVADNASAVTKAVTQKGGKKGHGGDYSRRKSCDMKTKQSVKWPKLLPVPSWLRSLKREKSIKPTNLYAGHDNESSDHGLFDRDDDCSKSQNIRNTIVHRRDNTLDFSVPFSGYYTDDEYVRKTSGDCMGFVNSPSGYDMDKLGSSIHYSKSLTSNYNVDGKNPDTIFSTNTNVLKLGFKGQMWKTPSHSVPQCDNQFEFPMTFANVSGDERVEMIVSPRYTEDKMGFLKPKDEAKHATFNLLDQAFPDPDGLNHQPSIDLLYSRPCWLLRFCLGLYGSGTFYWDCLLSNYSQYESTEAFLQLLKSVMRGVDIGAATYGKDYEAGNGQRVLFLMPCSARFLAVVSRPFNENDPVNAKDAYDILDQLGFNADLATHQRNAMRFLIFWLSISHHRSKMTEDELWLATAILEEGNLALGVDSPSWITRITQKRGTSVELEDADLSRGGRAIALPEKSEFEHREGRTSSKGSGSDTVLSFSPFDSNQTHQFVKGLSPSGNARTSARVTVNKHRSNARYSQSTDRALGKSLPVNTPLASISISGQSFRDFVPDHGSKSSTTRKHSSIASTIKKRGLFEHDPFDVAQALTWMLYSDCYRDIKEADLLTYSKGERNAACQKMIDMFDSYSWWPLSLIMANDLTVDQRLERTLFFLDVAEKCRDLCNFDAAAGLIAGLDSPLMKWLWTFKKKEHEERRKRLRRLTRDRRNFLVYHAELSKCVGKSYIPFLAVTKKKLVSLESRHSCIETEKGLIDFRLCISRKLIVRDFLGGQHCGYELAFDSDDDMLSDAAEDSMSSLTDHNRKESRNFTSKLHRFDSKSTSENTGSLASESELNLVDYSFSSSLATPVSRELGNLSESSNAQFLSDNRSGDCSSAGCGTNSRYPNRGYDPTRLKFDLHLLKVIRKGFGKALTKEEIEHRSNSFSDRVSEEVMNTLRDSGFM